MSLPEVLGRLQHLDSTSEVAAVDLPVEHTYDDGGRGMVRQHRLRRGWRYTDTGLFSFDHVPERTAGG